MIKDFDTTVKPYTSISNIAERAKRIVDVKEFAHAGAPLRVSSLDLHCPHQHQYILRMAVRVDGKDFYIPAELDWVKPAFEAALDHQRHVIKVEHSFCYITVRHGLVSSQTDDAWHVDGFSTKITHIPEQNYIWTDVHCTQYAALNVVFPDDFDPLHYNVNTYLERFVKEDKIAQCRSKVLYCMDPYILHRRPTVPVNTYRTFLRISFVPIEINDINNTPNPLIERLYSQDGVAHRNTLKDYPVKKKGWFSSNS